jgi:hypothetical protein
MGVVFLGIDFLWWVIICIFMGIAAFFPPQYLLSLPGLSLPYHHSSQMFSPPISTFG